MSDKEMQEIMKKAVAIVEGSNVPSDLRQAAFTHILNTLTGDAAPARSQGRSRPTRVRTHKANGDGKKRPLRKTKKVGPKTLIEEFAKEGFFETWRTLQEVQDSLEVRGRNYEQPAISPALLTLTQDKVLQRQRKAEGNRKIWVYKAFGS